MHSGPGGYWHHTGRIGHPAVRAESLHVVEGQMNLLFVVDHNLEELRHIGVEVDNLGGRNPEEGPVVGNLGSNLGGIGCMGLTC